MGGFLAAGVGESADLAIVLAAAVFAGAVVAALAGIPKIAGYLAAGAILGPTGFGLIDDPEDTRFVAELGVALLLFVVGLELSLGELRSNLRAGLALGGASIAGPGLLSWAGAMALGSDGTAAVIVGLAAGLSSTAAVLALLPQVPDFRGRTAAPIIAALIVQDIVAIAALAILPGLGGEGGNSAAKAALGVAAAMGVTALALPLLSPVIRMAFAVLSRRLDRELFLVAVVAVIALVAAGALELGLSIALGAFVAGLLIAQSGYAEAALHEMVSLRDLFSGFFFVAAGLSFDAGQVSDELGLLAVLLIAAIPVKIAAVAATARLAGRPWREAWVPGILLGNAGEFSFALVDVAGPDLLSDGERAAVLLTVVVSLIVTSVAVALSGDGVRAGLGRTRLPRGTTVLVGYGRLGRTVARQLRARNVPFVVAEKDHGLARLARDDGFHAAWGDIGRLGRVRALGRESLFIVTPEGDTGVTIVEELARLAPGSRVLAAGTAEDCGHITGIDLSLVEAYGNLAVEVADAVERALSGATVPLDRRARAVPEAACGACGGSGRRFSLGFFRRCAVCGGDGRRREDAAPRLVT